MLQGENVMNEFITIKKDEMAEIVEKKSKFIANIVKIETQKEAEEKIKEIKKKYYDAKHNCIAYRVYELENLIEKSSDDGEPSGTAGGPMLNILRNQELGNILVVVTRYFGGILLGTGGLVRAYSEATLAALKKAEKVKRVLGIEIQVNLKYSQFDNLKYYCQKRKINISNTNYLENISCILTMEEETKEKFMEDYNKKEIILEQIKILDKKIIDKSI